MGIVATWLEARIQRGNFVCGRCAQLCLTLFHAEQEAWLCLKVLVFATFT